VRANIEAQKKQVEERKQLDATPKTQLSAPIPKPDASRFANPNMAPPAAPAPAPTAAPTAAVAPDASRFANPNMAPAAAPAPAPAYAPTAASAPAAYTPTAAPAPEAPAPAPEPAPEVSAPEAPMSLDDSPMFEHGGEKQVAGKSAHVFSMNTDKRKSVYEPTSKSNPADLIEKQPPPQRQEQQAVEPTPPPQPAQPAQRPQQANHQDKDHWQKMMQSVATDSERVFKTPSFHRAMAKTRFSDAGDPTWGHFSDGASETLG
jgi:hypothetical protein